MDTLGQCYLLVLRLWLGATAGTLKGAQQLKVSCSRVFARNTSVGRIFGETCIKILAHRDILGNDP